MGTNARLYLLVYKTRRHDRNGCRPWLQHTCVFLASEVILDGARLVFPPVLRVTDAVGILVMWETFRPVSVRRRVAVQPRRGVPVTTWSRWRGPLVQTQPVISSIQINSVLTSHNVHTSHLHGAQLPQTDEATFPCFVKAKFHYASWFGACSELVCGSMLK